MNVQGIFIHTSKALRCCRSGIFDSKIQASAQHIIQERWLTSTAYNIQIKERNRNCLSPRMEHEERYQGIHQSLLKVPNNRINIENKMIKNSCLIGNVFIFNPHCSCTQNIALRSYHHLLNKPSLKLPFLNQSEGSGSYSTQSETPVLSAKQKLKRAIADYGKTVIVFHVGISLISLGACYLLISSGVDLGNLLTLIGIKDSTISQLATNTGSFVVAYAVHKVFAPVRISITLAATPFIVRYLRKIGILKMSKQTNKA